MVIRSPRPARVLVTVNTHSGLLDLPQPVIFLERVLPPRHVGLPVPHTVHQEVEVHREFRIVLIGRDPPVYPSSSGSRVFAEIRVDHLC